jgi:transcriptional regulator with XRE-family HTH domain
MAGQKENFFAENLRVAQAEANLTNQQVAHALGISESLLGKWRRGASKPSVDNAVALAKIVGRPVEWLTTDHRATEKVAA